MSSLLFCVLGVYMYVSICYIYVCFTVIVLFHVQKSLFVVDIICAG